VTADEVGLAGGIAEQLAVFLDNAELSAQTEATGAQLAHTQAQLLQSQKMDAVGRLAGGLAHDFNNMLTIIAGRTELLQKRLTVRDPARRDVDVIRGAGQRTAGLVRRLLAFSRRQVLEPKTLSLNELVRTLLDMLARLIGEDIELVTMLEASVGHIRADPSQLEHVIVNLVINARDAMPHGGRLTLETKEIECDAVFVAQHPGATLGPHVVLAVTDTGTGMDADTQARIFEPFFTTKEVGKGTGLGLSTVYGIVQQSGGTIEVQTTVGRGTAFLIYLPRVERPADPLVSHSALDHRILGGSERVLLVEDDDEVRELAHEVLQQRGYTVLATANAGEALLTCERDRTPIHLLVTDVVMPRMTGLELAERLRPLQPAMRVLYMSGYSGDRMSPVATPLLQKPFSPAELSVKVRALLDGSPAPDKVIACPEKASASNGHRR
jgi:two-component system, cell cycle sensor histidine kinase and response regulator CckA